MQGCVLINCPYWNEEREICTDPNDYIDIDGFYVCGRRDDAILVTHKPKFKCDTCKHQIYVPEDKDSYCNMGHWTGYGFPKDPDEYDPEWDDCEDYE